MLSFSFAFHSRVSLTRIAKLNSRKSCFYKHYPLAITSFARGISWRSLSRLALFLRLPKGDFTNPLMIAEKEVSQSKVR